jgi:hypothetical protein
LLFYCARVARLRDHFSRCPSSRCLTRSSPLELALYAAMPHLSAEAKQHILLEYAPRDPTRSFATLAARHGIKGGADVVRHWHDRWDGTPASLKRKEGTGKAPLLSRAEVSRHVRAPILAANHAHRASSYPDLLPRVQRKTGKQIALRTLRDYGKQQLGARTKHTKKRTADESEHTRHGGRRCACLCVEHAS